MNEVISDQLDQASALEQMASDMKIKEIQAEASKPIPTSEHCLWCAAKTKNGRRFCNRDCCDFWEKYGRQ